MSIPYICKKCGKEMWSLNEVIEYWGDIYCKRCNPSAQINKQQEITNEKIKPQKKEEVDVKSIEEISPAIYKKGDFIGQKYEVFGVLGEGACGIVYLVYSHETKSAYALKTFRDEYLEDVTTRERFKKEAQVWIDLERHPYLVSAYFVDEISGRLYIAMEHIAPDDEGLNTLEGYLRRRPPDLAQSLRWAIQFCHGMEHAYSKGIKAHRDIKPANILIGQDTAVKISDFGLAGFIGISKAFSGIKINPQRTISGETYQTMKGSAFGTPPYMPPEQFENAAGCDERSDIYSFGVVLYQMASGGKLPFLPEMSKSSEGDVFQKWYMLHSKASIPKLKSPLFPIIFRCLEKKPINRYFSFKELRRDFETLLKKQTGEVVKVPELKKLEAWEWHNKGASLVSLSKYQEAIVCFDNALEINPRYVETWNSKGIALDSLGKPQEAIACFNRALEINPRYAGAWYNKGGYLGRLGKSAEAIACINRALELNPGFAEAWNSKGKSLFNLGKPQEAIACYDRALEINPVLAEAWVGKGVALDRLGNPQEAIVCYDRTLEINPRNAEAWNNKGIPLGRLGKPQEAIACFDKALEINPQHAGAWYNKGVLLQMQRKFKETLQCFDNALNINPALEIALRKKGNVLIHIGEFQEAIICLDKAIKINSKFAESWNNKGLALSLIGNHHEAIVCCDKALEIDPKAVESLYNKGSCLLKLEKCQEAMMCFDKALEINPQHAGAWHGKGEISIRQGKLQEAVQPFQCFIKFAPPQDAKRVSEAKEFIQKIEVSLAKDKVDDLGQNHSEPLANSGFKIEDREPRLHHYLFSHMILPKLLFENPQQLVEKLLTHGKTFLITLWDTCADKISGIKEKLQGSGLDCKIIKVKDNISIILISLPKPLKSTEAYFTAIVYRQNKLFLIKQKGIARYITLERTIGNGDNTAVLCEWEINDKNINHINHGKRFRATEENFIGAIKDLIFGE